MLKFLNTRILKPLPEFKISEDVSRSCILSYLAYLEPDIFYLKWESYNASKKYENNTNSYRHYEKREKLTNDLFYGIDQVPIFYDGTINEKNTRDAQAYKIEKDNVTYIAFRGSSSVFDAVSDLDFIQVPFENGLNNVLVHRGFKMQLDSIKDTLFPDCDPTKKIVFCGHSLGGALATLAALYYKLTNPNTDVSCITFGAPRIGNPAFASLFIEKVGECQRYITEKDIVPVMSAIFNYVHVNNAYCIKEKQVYREEGDTHWTIRNMCSLLNIATPLYMHSYNTYLHLVMNAMHS